MRGHRFFEKQKECSLQVCFGKVAKIQLEPHWISTNRGGGLKAIDKVAQKGT